MLTESEKTEILELKVNVPEKVVFETYVWARDDKPYGYLENYEHVGLKKLNGKRVKITVEDLE
jgi:hypothetical protein